MRKLKALKINAVENVLTENELKSVFGGMYSYSGKGYVKLGCSGKQEHDDCYYKDINGNIQSGSCRYLPIAGFVCWSG